MLIVDAHCDTINRILKQGSDLFRNTCHFDIERALQNGSIVQFFTAFISPEYCQAYALKRALQIIDKLCEQVGLHNDVISLCADSAEIKEALECGKMAAVLSIEGGEAFQGDLAVLRMFYRLGVRSVCLTWNRRNEIADGVSDAASGGGLTPFGRDVVREMNRLGMIVDVSHISEKGFWDVLEISGSPVIASHSNSKKVCPHVRNLTDEQILSIEKCGGVIGINLYPGFLTESDACSIKDVLNHIEHIASLSGENHLGLGADLDGIEKTPGNFHGVQDIPEIFDGLLRLNYPESFVRKFAGENFLRVINQVMR